MKLPETGTHALVMEGVRKRMKVEPKRNYMGASELGIECDRQLWYTWHKPKQNSDPRVQMIFDMGHMLEEYVVKVLREAGLKVWSEDDNGEQFGFIDGFIAGHCDGVVQGLAESTKPHLLEIKTMNNKRFTLLEKKGVKVAERSIWVQTQVYAYKFELENALLVVINKDNCRMYYERIKLDATAADSALLRGEELIAQVDEPKRKYKNSKFFKCKFCDWADECWGGE